MPAEPFSVEALSELAGLEPGDLTVSIYLPTTTNSADRREDRLRLKNLLKLVRQRCDDLQLADDERPSTNPVDALLDDSAFWRDPAAGLAIFLARDWNKLLSLPIPVPELVIVSRRPHLTPLFPVAANNSSFYVLALSQDGSRLFQGSRDEMQEIALPDDAPVSLSAALGSQLTGQSLQFHSSRGAGAPPVYHGQGAAKDDTKMEIGKFFQRLDEVVLRTIPDPATPLILAGVDYLLPIYRSVSHYPNIAEESITGNPDHRNARQLHPPAWRLTEKRLAGRADRAASRFDAALQSERASENLKEILIASARGRIDTLFVDGEAQRWGEFDAESGALRTHPDDELDAEDLFNRAVIETHRHGGEVHVLPAPRIPGRDRCAAIFRY